MTHKRATPAPPGKWALMVPLIMLSTICVCAGALIAFYIFHEEMGYSGGKSGIIYIGGAFAGYMLTDPLWRLFRKRYPKAEAPASSPDQ